MPFPVHPRILRHNCGYALGDAGHDTRSLQAYLGHKNIQHTVRAIPSWRLIGSETSGVRQGKCPVGNTRNGPSPGHAWGWGDWGYPPRIYSRRVRWVYLPVCPFVAALEHVLSLRSRCRVEKNALSARGQTGQ
jgi:hypothetical protein